MQNSLRKINPEQAQLPQEIYIANVEDACAGEAVRVFVIALQRSVPVLSHSSEVSPLQIDDQVLVLLTTQGVIVMQRLRKPGELPQAGFSVQQDGSLQLQNVNGITLKTNNARIEIRANGRICVDGREIYAIADGKHRLQGATIELN